MIKLNKALNRHSRLTVVPVVYGIAALSEEQKKLKKISDRLVLIF